MTNHLTLFPDTNFFLECRDPDACPWHEITSADTITLVICRTVWGEIDKLKSSGRGRKSKRARLWSSRLREAAKNSGKTELRANNPNVVLWIPPPVSPLVSLPSFLDLSRPDEKAIADILALKSANPSLAHGVFFTDDGGAAYSARYANLQTVDIPLGDEENNLWRLPKEPDEAEKKISTLEKKIAALENQKPQIVIDVVDDDGDKLSVLNHQIILFSPITKSQIAALVAQAEQMHPIQTDFQTTPPERPSPPNNMLPSIAALFQQNLAERWIAPDNTEIEKYTNPFFKLA